MASLGIIWCALFHEQEKKIQDQTGKRLGQILGPKLENKTQSILQTFQTNLYINVNVTTVIYLLS